MRKTVKLDATKEVQKVNPTRNHAQLGRRVLKVQEECGELAEAYLGVSSTHNYKDKKWADVREEAIDVAIVALDIALTASPHENWLDDDRLRRKVDFVIKTKLAKWARNQRNRKEAIS